MWMRCAFVLRLPVNTLNTMCKHSSGCGTSDTINCKACGTSMCKGCKRNSADGTPVRSGNAAACGKCGKNY